MAPSHMSAFGLFWLFISVTCIRLLSFMRTLLFKTADGEVPREFFSTKVWTHKQGSSCSTLLQFNHLYISICFDLEMMMVIYSAGNFSLSLFSLSFISPTRQLFLYLTLDNSHGDTPDQRLINTRPVKHGIKTSLIFISISFLYQFLNAVIKKDYQ